MLNTRLVDIPVNDIQCDEIWGFVGMKEKTRRLRTIPTMTKSATPTAFLALERETKLLVAWHLGRRYFRRCARRSLATCPYATSGQFQIEHGRIQAVSNGDPVAMPQADFAQLVKEYATRRRHATYSPGEVTATHQEYRRTETRRSSRICTLHVERQNLTIRMQNRRMTRLSNGVLEGNGRIIATMLSPCLSLTTITFGGIRRP